MNIPLFLPPKRPNHNFIKVDDNENIIFIDFDQMLKNYRKFQNKTINLLKSSFTSFMFDIMPKHFSIATNNNNFHKFNIELLMDTSSLISNLLSESQDVLNLYLNIDDEKDVLGKFEKMFQGKTVFFDKNEIVTARKIVSFLGIDNCSDILKLDNEDGYSKKYFCLSSNDFIRYLENEAPHSFTIVTRKREYKCNKFGICSSNILLDSITIDPTTNSYIYDFDDENEEFQLISDLFNFKDIQITEENAYTLQKIMKDLQIKIFYKKISSFISHDELLQAVEDQQAIIDLNEELFSWLYHIKENNVEIVKNLIVNSDWIKTLEKIQELVAIILQVIRTDSTFQPHIVDLLIKLDKEADEKNCLKNLIPFLIEKLSFVLGDNLIICSFVYNLYRKNIITNEKLISMIKRNMDKKQTKKENFYSINPKSNKINNLVSWFYPEILKHLDTKNLEITYPFIMIYFQDNIDNYQKMRDKGDPDDELTIALRYDDVDTLQKIVIDSGLLNQEDKSNHESTSKKLNISDARVPYNLYEDFVKNGETTYINYACAYGSIKCFKYLLLNHANIDTDTFTAAVFGGNIEIIRIVNQICKEKGDTYNSVDQIIPSITKHQNDIFDWIFKEKFSKCQDDRLLDIILCAAKSGNAHVLAEIIYEEIDFMSIADKIFVEISKNGYALLTEFFLNIIKKTDEKNIQFDFKYSSYFGNISIFKLSFNNMNNENDLNDCLKTAIKYNYRQIIEYFFQNLYNYKLNEYKETVFTCLNSSISTENIELFDYFVQQFEKVSPIVFNEFNKFNQLLPPQNAERNFNIEICKKITDMAVKYNHKNDDFTILFCQAIISDEIEICQNIIEKKLLINYEKLSAQFTMLSFIKAEMFSLIIETAPPESKVMFLNKSFLEQAIKFINISLTDYLLKANVYSENALLLAVQSNNIDLVEIILKYHKNPCFINRISKNGTALHIAVENLNLSIVKILLSIPGINPNLYNQKQQTPLILAVSKINLEISNEILNFYDKKDQTQERQFNKSFEILLNFLFDESKTKQHVYLIRERKEEKLISDYKNQTDLFPILLKILDYRAVDPNVLINNWTILLYACKNGEIELATVLLSNEKTDVNICSPINGNSPLMVSIKYNHLEIAKVLIENPKTNLNIQNFEGETALTIAVSKQFENIVDLLINNERFDPGESCIDKAFFDSSGNISKLLSSVKSLDVNYLSINNVEISKDGLNILLNSFTMSEFYEEKSFITTLMNSIATNDIDKIDLIINHHSFDKTKSQIIRSIFAAVKIGSLEIFIKLISVINNDVNIYNSDRDFLLNFAIENNRTDIAKFILENPKFDPNTCDILSAFTFYVKNITQESIDMLNIIYNYDKEHLQIINFNNLLPSGESFFTLIGSQQYDSSLDGKIATFFIEHGADPNKPDRKGFYPLEYAILRESTEYVRALINSNKIDFTQFVDMKNSYENPPEECLKASKAKKKTFLHIAARSKNPEILKIIIEKNAIDINSTDELGETPLFEACRYKQIKNIEYLATLSTIDYNHCNNEGYDVLKIMKIIMNLNFDFEITDRDDYFVALMSTFNTDKNNDLCYINYYHLD